MVKVTHTDGTTVEYELIDDPDEPAGVISVKNVAETIMGEQEDIKQMMKINLAHLSIEDIEQRFDAHVAEAVKGEIE